MAQKVCKKVIGWQSASSPPQKDLWYDLVRIRDINGKTQSAWWNGKAWCFGKNHQLDTIVEWERLL